MVDQRTRRHGTRTEYCRYACRCELCRAANTEYQRQQRLKNPDYFRNYNKTYKANHQAYYKQYMDRWHKENREHENEYKRAYQKTAAGKAVYHRRRGVVMDQQAKDWYEIVRLDPCVYCGNESTDLEHIDSVLHGGSGDWDNIATACRSCNASKGKRSLILFLMRGGLE